jgi:hypothetical protein
MVQMFGLVQGRSGAGLTAESFKGLRIFSQFAGQELQSDQATKFSILGLVDHSHSAATKLFDYAVVRNGLPDHWAEMLGREVGQVNEGQKVGGFSAP